jgi:hypothetical protein
VSLADGLVVAVPLEPIDGVPVLLYGNILQVPGYR